MTTARTIIKRALRRLAVVPIDQNPSDGEIRDSLEGLNDLLHGMKGEGGDIEFGTLGLDDDLPVAREFNKPITDLLVLEMAPEFSVVLSSNQALAALNAKHIMKAAFVDVPVLEMDDGLRERVRGEGDEVF